LALAGAAAGIPVKPRPATAVCDISTGQFEQASPGRRIVLDRVGLPPVDYVNQLAKPPRPGLERFSKIGVFVSAGTAVTLEVPVGQRRNYALEYGDSGGGRIRYAWSAWPGGFLLRNPACVPLLVHVDGRSERILVAIGRPCPPA